MTSSQQQDCNRNKGLEKLGVSEDDVRLAERLLKQIQSCSMDPNKAERVFGYVSSRLAREKALRLLGASEEEVELENAKNLGALGIAGRRRSFANVKPQLVHSRKSLMILPRKSLAGKSQSSSVEYRRRRSAESRLIRTQMATVKELESLRERVSELENILLTALPKVNPS